MSKNPLPNNPYAHPKTKYAYNQVTPTVTPIPYTPYVQQPQQQPPPPSIPVQRWQGRTRWSHGLSDCTKQSDECCYSCWCYPCFSCQLAWRMNESCWAFCCIPGYLSILRTKMRTQFQIKVCLETNRCIRYVMDHFRDPTSRIFALQNAVHGVSRYKWRMNYVREMWWVRTKSSTDLYPFLFLDLFVCENNKSLMEGCTIETVIHSLFFQSGKERTDLLSKIYI